MGCTELNNLLSVTQRVILEQELEPQAIQFLSLIS